MAKLEGDHGRLLISFQHQGRRCREYLGLKDTRENRRAAAVMVKEIELEMANWFTESFDTADPKDAKAMLAELSH